MREELEELIYRFLEGTADAEEVGRLDQLLRSDPEACRMLVDIAALETQLRQVVSVERGASELSAHALDQIGSPSSEEAFKARPVSRPPRVRTVLRSWKTWAACIAVVACTVAGLLIERSGPTPTPPRDKPPVQAKTPLKGKAPDQGKVTVQAEAPKPTPPPPIAKVVDVRGTAWRLPGGKRKAVALKSADEVHPGDAVRTDSVRVARVELRYADGTVVRLHNGTQCMLMEDDAAKRVHLDCGTLSVSVELQSKDRDMTVATTDAAGKVVGARLTLSARPGVTTLDVQEGEVEFSRLEDNKTITVCGTQHAVVQQGIAYRAQDGESQLAQVPAPAGPQTQVRLTEEIEWPWGVAYDGWNLWISNGGYLAKGQQAPETRNPRQLLFKVRPVDGVVLDTLDLSDFCDPMGAAGLAWDGSHLWVAGYWDAKIFRVDPSTGRLERTLSAQDLGISDLEVGGGYLWGVGRAKRDFSNRPMIHKMTLEEGKVLATFPAPGQHVFFTLAYQDNAVWQHAVCPLAPGKIYKLSPADGSILAIFRGAKRGTRVMGLCKDPDGRLWLLSASRRWLRPVARGTLKEAG